MTGCRSVRILGMTLLVVLTLSGETRAQMLPLGGRTAAMGGAGTASGRDAAMPYLNPAGYGLVPHHTLSLSASLYRQENIEVSDFYYHGVLDPALGSLAGDPSPAGNRLSSTKLTSFPGAASALWHFGDADDPDAVRHVFALGLFVPRNRRQSFVGDFAMRFGLGGGIGMRLGEIEITDQTEYQFGPTYAVRLGRFRLGLSAFFSYVDYMRSNSFNNSTYDGIQYATISGKFFAEADIFGFQPVVGFQWNPVGGFSLGASVAAPTVHIWSKMEATTSSEGTGPQDIQGDNFVQEVRTTATVKLVSPARAVVGAVNETLDGLVALPGWGRSRRELVGAVYLYAMTHRKTPALEQFGNSAAVEEAMALVQLSTKLKWVLKTFLEEDVKVLPRETDALLQGLPQILTGPDLVALPRAARALGIAGSDMVAATAEIPETIQGIEVLFDKLKGVMVEFQKGGEESAGKEVSP